MNNHEFNKIEVINKLENCLNKTLGEVDENNVFDKAINKPKITGIAGDVIEQSVFGYSADSYQRPDLNIDGNEVELKTTGIKINKKNEQKYEAKEPMSITAVSPETIINEEFYDSNFWHKLENLLLVYYHYDSEKTVKAIEYAKFYIKGYEFHKFSEEDEKILKNDWTIVRNFIRNLHENYKQPEKEYYRISSELRPQLMFIDIAPKFNYEKRQRGRFRLKRATVTNIVQNHFGNSLEQLPNNYDTYAELDCKLHSLTSQYKGKTIKELIEILDISYDTTKNDVAKSITEQIVVSMFGAKKAKKISKVELFNKIGLNGKTITVTKTGDRTEDMKLFRIDFDEWCAEETAFEDSLLYQYFSENQFLFIVFEESNKNDKLLENKFIGFKRFSFSEEFINNECKKVWDEVRNLVINKKLEENICLNKDNNPILNKTGELKTVLNFPKSADNNIFLRGSGKDSTDKRECVNGINMYYQNVWIKGKYITELLKDVNYI